MPLEKEKFNFTCFTPKIKKKRKESVTLHRDREQNFIVQIALYNVVLHEKGKQEKTYMMYMFFYVKFYAYKRIYTLTNTDRSVRWGGHRVATKQM